MESFGVRSLSGLSYAYKLELPPVGGGSCWVGKGKPSASHPGCPPAPTKRLAGAAAKACTVDHTVDQMVPVDLCRLSLIPLVLLDLPAEAVPVTGS